MPDTIDADGLQIKSLSEITAELVAAFQTIYGADINVDSDSPDGQQIGIFAQNGVDIREVLERINAGFDPEQAEGVLLDQRVGINGIKRQGGTYTMQDVEVTVDRALNLDGLDGDIGELDGTGYTLKDDAGNEYILAASQSPVAAGTYTYAFRSKAIGEVLVSPNTITTPVTIVAGVTGVNNPAAATVTGQDEETDAQLRARRRASITVTSTGYLDAIQAALAEIEGVTTAIVLENDSNIVDSNGTDPHTIWAIVEGGADADIAAVLYAKKSAGSGMRGTETADITRPTGETFSAYWDDPINQNLWIEFDIILPGGTVDVADLKDKIVENIIWSVGADAQGDTITAYLKGLNPLYQITNMEVSDDDITYVEIVSPTGPQYRFINATTRITIN